MSNSGLDNWKSEQPAVDFKSLSDQQLEALGEAVAAEIDRRNELAISKMANNFVARSGDGA